MFVAFTPKRIIRELARSKFSSEVVKEFVFFTLSAETEDAITSGRVDTDLLASRRLPDTYFFIKYIAYSL